MTARRRFDEMQRRLDRQKQKLRWKRGACPWMAIVECPTCGRETLLLPEADGRVIRELCPIGHIIAGPLEGWVSEPTRYSWQPDKHLPGSALYK